MATARSGSGRRAACALVIAVVVGALGCGDGPTDPRRLLDGSEPDVEAQPFSLDVALELARLSLQAYQMLNDQQDGRTFTLPSPYTLVAQYLTPERYAGVTLPAVETEVPIAFIATRDDVVFVVYRGTKTISEWIDDATFQQVGDAFVSSGGLVELGFSKIYATIHDPIVAQVQSLFATGAFQTLYVTGHSLGAALAVLSAPELAARTGVEPVLYNFAGPRVGDPAFVLRYDELVPTSWRVVNTNDIVPTLPPVVAVYFDGTKEETFFYEHVPSEDEITFGQPIESPSDVAEDHSLCNYYDTLCDQTSDPTSCKALADGADGCNPPA